MTPKLKIESRKKKNTQIKKPCLGTSLAVQWLGLHASNAGCTGSIPGRGPKIPHAMWYGQKLLKIKKKLCLIQMIDIDKIYHRF